MENFEQPVKKEPEIGNAIVKLDTINKEYEFRLPKNLSGFRLQCRDGTVLRYSFLRGVVGTAAPSEPYATILANDHLRLTGLNLEEETVIYITCGSASKVAEIVMWYGKKEADVT